MLNKRCGVAESRAKMMVAVMRELQRRRKNANILAGKYGFITPRDLFGWAERHRGLLCIVFKMHERSRQHKQLRRVSSVCDR
jgi:midasin (ATPase involved in ribosome maturation)